MQTVLRKLIFTALFSMACACAQILVIPQVADGGGWRSTIVLNDTTALDINGISLTFFKDIGGGVTVPWTPTFLEGSFSGSVPAGSSVFLHTPGIGPLTQGWAQLIGGSGLTAYVIYTYSANGHDQDSTAPAVSSATRILVPFDNTIPTGKLKSLATAIAVVNPNPIPLTISVNLEIAGTGSAGTALNLPPNGQMAFVMADQFTATAGKSGLAEFYSTTGSFSIIALRGNPTGGLTSLRVYNESGSPVISTSGGGGGGGGGGPVPSGDITFAGFGLSKLTTSFGTNESISGTFDAFTPAAWNIPYSATPIDKCYVYQLTFSGADSPSAPSLSMDAGKITLAGPGLPGGSIIVPEIQAGALGPAYQASHLTLVDGGTYTLTGAGGTQVEAFTKVSATLPKNFTTNVLTITSIDRTKPLPITWTGTGFDNVVIGAVTTTLSGMTVDLVVVTCVVPASLGAYSIPAAALSKLSAVTAPLGSLSATTAPAIQGTAASRFIGTSLTPNLVGGGKITYGNFTASFTVQQTVAVQ
jgi:hypothetical protein